MFTKNTLGVIFLSAGLVAYYLEIYSILYYILNICMLEFMINIMIHYRYLNIIDWLIFYVLSSLIDNFIHLKRLETGRIILYSNISDGIQQLVGKKWGRCHIVRSISPNKTLEGYIGGFLGMTLISYLSGISLVYYFTGILGDLMSSYSKRKLGIKDWSCLLGSHGGFLDRFNSSILGLKYSFFVYK
jgi:CDP-diglyceride synthetase